MLLALCVLPLLPPPAETVLAWSRRLPGIAVLAASEFAIGYIFGLAVDLFFAAVQWAGQALAQQAGLSLGAILDPLSGAGGSALAEFKYLIALGVFLGANLHLELVAVVGQSFNSVPVGATLQWDRVGEQLVLGLGSTMWQLGLRIVLPAMLGVLLVTVGLAFVSRAVPEINVFLFGFGLQALVCLWLLYLALPFVVDLMREGIERMLWDARGLLAYTRGG